MSAPTLTGKTLGESCAAAECFNREVIRTLEAPAKPESGIWVLGGNLCPGGAVMKPSAAEQFTVHAPWPRGGVRID